MVSFCAEVEMMKERFAKLLLGEDMSGGGKGVCTALAISNAITNLSGLFSHLHLLPIPFFPVFCTYVLGLMGHAFSFSDGSNCIW